MGFMDKVKKILFDEEEVPAENDTLPERTPKKEKKVSTGFIDYHNDEEEDENPIVELTVPKDDEKEIEEQIPKKPSYLDDYKDDFGNEFIGVQKENVPEKNYLFEDEKEDTFEIPTRVRNYDDLESSFMEEKEEKNVEVINSYRSVSEPTRERKEIKDYRKMLSDESTETKEKKPFKNTPVISPIWGILDKNYTPDQIVERQEDLNKINTGVVPRTFGPVSYNDQPLPNASYVKPEKKTELKKDLVELNETINNMVVEEDEIELPQLDTKNEEIKRYEEAIVNEIESNTYEEEKEDTIEIPIKSASYDYNEADDQELSTDNYDELDEIQTSDYDSYTSVTEDVPTHSIEDMNDSIETKEEEYNNIEDAFEATNEYSTVIEEDDDDDNVVDFDAVVHKKKYDDDDEGLDNTIETDLFNLIDSMYKSEEDK